ncbi:hypothetical protein IWX49DRAFT_67792 [Phyllosticta citricarpa]|uniref:Uncharacterized protein n=2 Tax=Phyllosticta TaxID=121621 RepID=A0ABR1LUD9_9PEZI
MTAVVLPLAGRQCDGCGDEDEVQMELRMRPGDKPRTSSPPSNSHDALFSPLPRKTMRSTDLCPSTFSPLQQSVSLCLRPPPRRWPRRIEDPDLGLCGSLERVELLEQIFHACIRREDEVRYLVRPRRSKIHPAFWLGAGVAVMLWTSLAQGGCQWRSPLSSDCGTVQQPLSIECFRSLGQSRLCRHRRQTTSLLAPTDAHQVSKCGYSWNVACWNTVDV